MGYYPRGPHLVGVEAIDGKFWNARVARRDDLRALNGVERGAIVSLRRAAPGLKPSDRTIAEIAGEDRVYSLERHKALRPSDRNAYIQMHVRRLQALRREGVVEQAPDGAFHLPSDYCARVLRVEARGGRESARIDLLDPHPLERQKTYRGPTWLDRLASGEEDKSQLRHEGFGAEARAAWLRRAATLVKLGLARQGPRGFDVARDWREHLKRMERDDLLENIERRGGRVAHTARDGEQVAGIFVRRLHAGQEIYALVAPERTATLAPWRPELDRALNQFISGHVNRGEFDFRFGRGVGHTKSTDLRKGLGLDR